MAGADLLAENGRIGRYELLLPVGTGGMGTVYLGRSEILAGVYRDVAVKVMHPQLRANPEVAPELLREAQLAARIRHPNVVMVHEAGDSPRGVFLAMDYVEGVTLARLLRAARKRQEKVPLRVAGKILRDALTGLHAAHELSDENGVPLELIHRDFSPQNILVGSDGITKLTDFGVAKALRSVGATATGVVKGKVAYMAPEQARGEHIDRRCDVWAAGVVVWETLIAERLFRAESETAILLQIVSGERPPRLSSHRPEVPAELDEAVAAALEPSAAARLSSALVFRKRIEEALFAGGGMADEDEVAGYLEELVGAEISERRAEARRVMDQRVRSGERSGVRAARREDEQRVELKERTGPHTHGMGSAAGQRRDDGMDGALSAATVRARSARGTWVLAGALAAAAISGLVLATVGGLDDETSAQSAAQPPAPLATGAPALAPPFDPPTAMSTSDAARALRIVADAPIAQLEIDGRTLLVPRATRELSVPLEGEAAKHLVAMTADGRSLEVSLSPEQERVELAFPPRRSAPRARRSPVPAPAPKVSPKSSPDDDALAESPYGAD